MERFRTRQMLLILGGAIALALFLGYGAYRYLALLRELEDERVRSAFVMNRLEAVLSGLRSELAAAEDENANLSTTLAAKEAELGALGGQITKIAGTVGTLEKLAKTDPELLRKYSKVFFLNEHYVPGNLVVIAEQYILDKEKPQQIHAQVAPFLAELLAAAEVAGTPLRVISAYRSFGTQSTLKSGYTVTYGSGANQFSADQGYSEHQLGTTVDFTTPELGLAFTKFESEDAYAWLLAHAHEYGFALSYPAGNAYYAFEPWHWRFVGRELAAKLHAEGKHFYDLDQKAIDEYLVKIFD